MGILTVGIIIHNNSFSIWKDFQQKLQNARRIIVIGNGGIATELV